ncbi:hypothetical protein ASD99_15720 [Mesorhizobium sp. Root695]|uniref:hypothetical protein n=1 Tax=unclassified Mesorhizobium TaxID=325217 RepID=UPI0006FFC6F0|nr:MULTISPECIES: hypothetical protein [unclassified Mesorhizobium]KQU97127.1 hypothetical protein ASD12_22175 [Mesorhizobium sp. Root102]KRB13551.1 hypothetical protein ASD99_15720 [Mesorhizobium sp. Root695]
MPLAIGEGENGIFVASVIYFESAGSLMQHRQVAILYLALQVGLIEFWRNFSTFLIGAWRRLRDP